ncbi:gastrin/cholecystokinin type B receptor-like [Halictus rubicundus]|uniref:gastrin/cholecystokinin type B receptor-like n=1 Tax=Halictus rubicundus TaxID=77578 RepID=UPI004034FCDA
MLRIYDNKWSRRRQRSSFVSLVRPPQSTSEKIICALVNENPDSRCSRLNCGFLCGFHDFSIEEMHKHYVKTSRRFCKRKFEIHFLIFQAVADLLLGIFCMPFTLLSQILKNFIFGIMLCKLISYFQVASVSVVVWTLVAISLERYFAICKTLESRRWQTKFHAYKMIAIVWIVSLIWGTPMLIVSNLQSLRGGELILEENTVTPSPSLPG